MMMAYVGAFVLVATFMFVALMEAENRGEN